LKDIEGIIMPIMTKLYQENGGAPMPGGMPDMSGGMPGMPGGMSGGMPGMPGGMPDMSGGMPGMHQENVTVEEVD
jgi:hypothetical protein